MGICPVDAEEEERVDVEKSEGSQTMAEGNSSEETSDRTTLEYSDLEKSNGALYNPDWKADGYEGGVDCNALPWLDLTQMPGCFFKPLRVSRETGHFTVLIKVPQGVTQSVHMCLGPCDTLVLSGKMSYPDGPLQGSVGPGSWGYTPANHKMNGTTADEDTEYLATFYGALAFLNDDNSVKDMFSSVHVRAAADSAGIPLVPTTLAEALLPAPVKYTGPADPLAIAQDAKAKLCAHAAAEVITGLSNPHYVDTNALPWIEAGDGVSLKIMRVSTETGTISLIVRQNGQAAPHYHLGPADFFIMSGRIGYRAGPKEGYGPGTYMYEPAGARHEATQRVDEDEDLIYTANVWGPIQFDTGPGTPPLLVLSWMQYLAMAQASSTPLLASQFANDQMTMLATGDGHIA